MIKWTEDLATGVDLIDNQHKELFSRVNGLLGAMSQGKGKEEVSKVLDFLQDYVISHFGAEERLMRELQYPGFERHRGEHESYKEKLALLRKRFEAEGKNSLLAIDSQRLLVDWWFSHIGVTDKALGAFITTKSR